jgi:hypothetical protein
VAPFPVERTAVGIGAADGTPELCAAWDARLAATFAFVVSAVEAEPVEVEPGGLVWVGFQGWAGIEVVVLVEPVAEIAASVESLAEVAESVGPAAEIVALA